MEVVPYTRRVKLPDNKEETSCGKVDGWMDKCTAEKL